MADTHAPGTGPPARFGLSVPASWPRVEPSRPFADQLDGAALAADIELSEQTRSLLEQAAAEAAAADTDTRLAAVMVSAEADPRPLGVLSVHLSERVGEILRGLAGVDTTADGGFDVGAVGRLQDTEVSIVEFDTVGAVSCVTSRRRPPASAAGATGTLLRAYVLPEPHTMRAALVLYVTADLEPTEPLRTAFAELCNTVTATFTWYW